MTKKSQFNNDELQMDTTVDANKPILQYVTEDVQTGLRNPFADALPNEKFTFRNHDVTVSDNMEGRSDPTPLGPVEFAYPGTDKGVNEKQWGSS